LSGEITPFTLVQLTDMVAHHAVQFELCYKKKGGGEEWVEVDPLEEVISAYLGAGHSKHSDIRGFIASPTMRPDRSIITKKGFDTATKLYYMPTADVQLPEIKEKPRKEDALAALKLLNELLDGFPFEGEVEIDDDGKPKWKAVRKSIARSAALAGLMTAVV